MKKHNKYNVKARDVLLISIFFIIFLLCANLTSCVYMPEKKDQFRDEVWEQVPLRSSAQKEAGMMGGEGMQMIYDIAYSPSNPDVVYLVSNTSQVWKSIDGGTSWKMKHRGFLSSGGISLSVDPVNEEIVYVAGSLCRPKKPPVSSSADGIYMTRDGGENWSLVKRTKFFGETIEGNHFAFELTEDSTSSSRVIYAGTHVDGLLISEDGGEKWRPIGFEGDRILDMKINPFNSSIIYVLTNKGLFHVSVIRYEISQVTQLGENLKGTIKTFTVNQNNPSVMYAAMGKRGIYKSTDSGRTFFVVNYGLPENLDYSHIASSPVYPDYLYVSAQRSAGISPYWSHDGGQSWHMPETIDKKDYSLTRGRYFTAQISPHPVDKNTALTSTNGMARIIRTMDGGITWDYSGNGYTGGRKPEGRTSQAFYSDPDKMIFFLMDFGPALTIDGGASFRLLNIPRGYGGTTRVGAVSPVEDNLIVTAIGKWEKQILIVSTDGGENWNIIKGTDDVYKFIAFHPQKPNIIYAYGFRSKDSGMNWKKLPHKIYGMFRGDGDIVYSVKEGFEKSSLIIRSDDQGDTWLNKYPPLPFEMNNIYEMDVDPSDPDRIYIASSFGLYLYDSRKNIWEKKGEQSGLEKDRFGNQSVKNVAVDPLNPEVIYLSKVAFRKGHSNGIFRSVDSGQTWMNITYNLGPEFTASSISISPTNGTVFIGSSHGTWKLAPPYGL